MHFYTSTFPFSKSRSIVPATSGKRSRSAYWSFTPSHWKISQALSHARRVATVLGAWILALVTHVTRQIPSGTSVTHHHHHLHLYTCSPTVQLLGDEASSSPEPSYRPFVISTTHINREYIVDLACLNNCPSTVSCLDTVTNDEKE